MPTTLPAAQRKRNRPNRNPSHSKNPVYPSAANLPAPLPASDDVEMMANGVCLHTLGNLRAHALGFLSALLAQYTHRRAFAATGLSFCHISSWQALCPEFGQLYRLVLQEVDVRKAQVLEDEAFEWACSQKSKGIYHDGKRIDTEAVHSDKMHDLMLRGLLPGKYGKVDGEGSQQAVQVNITL